MANRNWRVAVLSAIALAALAVPASAALQVKVLSSAPQLVSGKEALIEISGATAPPVITVNERTSGDTTGLPAGHGTQVDFKPEANDPTKLVGLVTNLQFGPNAVTVTAGKDSATLTLVAHDINGELFAGAQDAPFLCEISAFSMYGLKQASDTKTDPLHAQCAAVRQVNYFYRNTAGKWLPFDVSKPRPTDIDKGANGQAMIIRQEMGVINRAAYVISIPHDPATGPAPTPTDRGGAWTGKLVYSFGPGAKPDGHHMGRGFGGLNAGSQFVGDGTTGSMNWYVDHGYAVAAASLNAFGTTTDSVVSAETAYRVKEQFIKEYGPPVFTVGMGASGGSMQQNLISNAYPGLLDGIIPSWQFADAMTFFQPLSDCQLLANLFKQGTWTKDQMNAVSGMYWGYCVSNGVRYTAENPTNCDAAVLTMQTSQPDKIRPDDIHCTFQDDLAQVFGLDPKTGFAKSPWDNVGVQYGLQALNNGVINWDQFIDINKRIGGRDLNGNLVAQREVGDPDAIRAAYATGQINEYNGGNASVPIISTRFNLDADPWARGDANVDVHDRIHSAITDARLQKYNGTDGNYVQMLAATVGTGYATDPGTVGSPFNMEGTEAVAQMDAWLTAVASDKSTMPLAQKVAADKPKTLVNECWTVDGKAAATADWSKPDTQHGTVQKVTDWNQCNQLFPIYSDPRIAAGGPMTDDVVKCQLKPVDPASYKTAPTADQLAQLKTVFPNGVCDYSKPGVGQDAKVTTWAVFSDYGKWNALATN
jgi:hypothetical protein